MKGIFSVATFLALTSALVSAAPFTRRGSVAIPASELWVITNPAPADIITPGGTSTAQIFISDGSGEMDTIVSFDVTGLTPSNTSTCQFVIQNIPAPTGSGIVQLFTLGGQVASPLTSVPYYDQYEGQYDLTTNPSTPIDVQFVPCNFENDAIQFVIRPQNTDDSITWVQDSTSVGAFLVFTP